MKSAATSCVMQFFFWMMMQVTGLAQPSTLTLYSLTESNGLSDNRVTCVFQDYQGFMWIGTEDGLNRYDGSAFTVFRRRNESADEIAGNHIVSITEDTRHHLWISTRQGFSEYDPEKNSFHSWLINIDKKDINVIEDLLPDELGNVWVATFGGLVQFNRAQNKFTLIPNVKGDASDNKMVQLLADKKGRFWIATYNGLWQFWPEEKKFARAHTGLTSLVNTLTEGDDGRLWIGYWSYGLQWFNPDTDQNKIIEVAPSNVGGVAIVKSPQGKNNVWCSNLSRVNEDGSVTSYQTNINPPTHNFHVTKLYGSSDGLLWLCSDKGALIMDPLKQFFHHTYFPDKITHQSAAFQQKGNDIYIGGAADNFLKLYDSSFHQLKSYALPASAHAIALLSIVREDPQHVWLCAEDRLVLLNEQTAEQKTFFITEKECNVRTRNFFNTIFIDSKGDHWIFPWRSGIWKFDKETGKFTLILEGLTVQSGVRKKLVIAAAVEDALGNVWFADLDEGLIRYDRKKNTFTEISDNFDGKKFSANNVFYEKPYIWTVTTGRVIRVHEETLVAEHWAIPEELNKTVTGLIFDKQNRIWITTRSGLLSFDKGTQAFKHYTVNDGLADNMMIGSIFCLRNGKIIYSDDNYVTLFDPRELAKPTAVPRVMITSVLSQNQVIPFQANAEGKKLTDLDYTYNNFTFNWAVIHYSNPLQNSYYCKLSGVDQDWKYVGSSGRVQYAALPPGHYVFEARGATSDGVMNEHGDRVMFVIHPPFWKTWWFFFTCVAFFLALTYSWYRYRLNESLKTEKLRNRISTDLHDEIGSTLSSISIMSDLVVQKTGEPRTSEVANEIKDNAIILMDRMDDIVWSINPRNDSLENLLLRVKRFAAQLFEAKDIDYEINISPSVQQVKLPMEFRQNIYLILKEAINNVVKHAHASRAVIDVRQEQSLLSVTITDNGRGFTVDHMSMGNGIASMNSRARDMNVRLSVESEKEKGTTVRLNIKIK